MSFMAYVVQRYVKEGKTVEVKVPMKFKDDDEWHVAGQANFPESVPLFSLWESKNPGWYILDLDRGERARGGPVQPDGRIHVYRTRYTYSLPAEEVIELGCDLSPVKKEGKTLEEWDVIYKANNADLVSSWTALHYLSTQRVTEILKEAKDATLAYVRVHDEHRKKQTEGLFNSFTERKKRERKSQQEAAEKRTLEKGKIDTHKKAKTRASQ